MEGENKTPSELTTYAVVRTSIIIYAFLFFLIYNSRSEHSNLKKIIYSIIILFNFFQNTNLLRGGYPFYIHDLVMS